MYEEVKHPCIQHKLALIRDVGSGHKIFRELATEITMFVCYEALKNIRLKDVDVETPLAVAKCQMIDEDIVVVPILRAGIGMLDAILSLIPSARVGFVGLERDEETALPTTYYKKMPRQIRDGISIIVDPMLATGGSTIAAIRMLKEQGAERILVVCIVTCPEGLKAVGDAYPDVHIYTASIDPELNDKKYIVPGLGDAGDRLYGTI
ncbi:MAG: uracil phosphoribosyltransferase [Woeseia sp.]|nr:uracil phosphoribosyltransferase [Woeseia sp.]|tara:strand:- start:465 stop:1085 length:621 start_codon:yes stop_codon:yes gene_type:complete